MTYEEFREAMESYRRAADAEASARKDSQDVLDRLQAIYGKFDPSEKTLANRVLLEWLLSADEGKRFDALALTHEFRIAEALPVLHTLTQRLKKSTAPSAPYELEKVNRIMERLRPDGRLRENGES